jgi:Putative porin
MNKIFFFFLLLLICNASFSQGGSDLFSGRGNQGSGKKDSIGFEHRNDAKDSITISFRYLDSLRSIRLDTSINDFYKYYAVPATLQYLGNTGTAGYPLIFSPFTKTGFDAGFHSFDAYRYTIETARFFKTTKPFTQLSYQLATGKEQMIKILHTQNPRPNFNFGFEYRLINAPGFFINQNSNHTNYRLFSNYQGKRKRYAAYFFIMGNSIKSSENGGITSNAYLDTPIYSKRFSIPVNLSFSENYNPNPFNSFVTTGHKDKDFTFFLRQSYDIGKNDSIAINDSTTEYLFYSKLRFQHTFTYTSSSFTYIDTVLSNSGRIIDSAIYKNWYDTSLRKSTKLFQLTDAWKIVSNDFSLLQFPDTKNSGQYLLAGARLENIKGTFIAGSKNYYNIILHGEYRNKTRNKLWDILAKGEFYLNGFNSGDYSAYATLSRFLNKRFGNVSLLFQNVNRSPSFIYNSNSSYNFEKTGSLGKENITIFKATADNPFISLSAANYFITNYTYFATYYKTDQYSKVINILQVSASKKFRLSKRWNLYSEITVQPTDAASPIKLPLVFTRNRLAYEGVFFKNLTLSTGIEFRYYTPYKAYDYSPVMGQFVPQDSVKLTNRPDISGFMHFRIKTFTGFLRAENLNTVSFQNGFGFTKDNFGAPHYVYPGFLFRFGIQWNFVN